MPEVRGDSGAVLQTAGPIAVPGGATGRFLVFGMDMSGVGCNTPLATFTFSVIAGASTTAVPGTVSPCTAPMTGHVAPANGTGVGAAQPPDQPQDHVGFRALVQRDHRLQDHQLGQPVGPQMTRRSTTSRSTTPRHNWTRTFSPTSTTVGGHFGPHLHHHEHDRSGDEERLVVHRLTALGPRRGRDARCIDDVRPRERPSPRRPVRRA